MSILLCFYGRNLGPYGSLRVDCMYHEALDSSVQVRDVVRTGTFISEVIN